MISCALVCLAEEEDNCDGVIYTSVDKTCRIGKVQESEDNECKNHNDEQINIWRKIGSTLNVLLYSLVTWVIVLINY